MANLGLTKGSEPIPATGTDGRGEWIARRLNSIIQAIRADNADEVHAVADDVIERAPEATALFEVAAEFAVRQGDWARAVRYRVAVSAAKPQDQPATVALVRLLARAGATSAALDLVGRLLEQAPIGAGYRRLQLEVLLAASRPEAATNLCQTLMESPADGTAGFMVDVAQILMQAEDFERARSWIETALHRHQASTTLARLAATIAYRQRRWDDAERLWGQLAETDDHNIIKEARVFRARIAAATGGGEAATRIYGEVLEDDPANERAARHVVRQCIAAGKLDEAQAALELFEARVGRGPLVVRLRAMLAMGRRDSAAAIAEYENGIAEHPKDVELKCRFADLLDDLGDNRAVDAVLRQAEALAPRDPRVLSRRLAAGATQGLAPGRLLVLADRLLAVRPGDLGTLRQKANLLIRLGDRHEAVKVLLSALDANPANVPLWTSVCSNLLALNENRQVDALVERALNKFTEEAARDLMAVAEILDAADRGEEAADYADRAVTAEPEMGEARLLAARLWEGRGLYRRAWPHLLAAQDLDAGRAREPLTFARVARALHYVDARPVRDAECDHFPDALFDRLSRSAIRRRFVEAEPLVLHVTSSLAAGGSERQVALTVQGLAATSGALRPELVVQDMNPLTGRDFFLPAARASGARVSALRELRGEGVVRELLADYPGLRSEISLLSALPTEVANVALPLYAVILERRPRAVHLWQDAIIVAGGMAAMLAGVPHIVLATRSTRPIERQRARPYLKAGYHALLRYPGTTMLNNSLNGARDYADWLGIDADRIQTLYNGFVFDELRACADPTLTGKIRRQLGAGREDVVIGGVMRCSFEKRPDLWTDAVIALARANPRIRGLLVGEGPMRAEMQARVEAADLAGRVQCVGRQTPIEPWMRAMDILFLSSVTEGLPNVLIEAQALGVAVATLRVGGAPETVRENETSLVIDEGAAADIAAAIAPLTVDAGMRRRFGAAGVKWTEAAFSLNAAVARLGDIYAEH